MISPGPPSIPPVSAHNVFAMPPSVFHFHFESPRSADAQPAARTTRVPLPEANPVAGYRHPNAPSSVLRALEDSIFAAIHREPQSITDGVAAHIWLLPNLHEPCRRVPSISAEAPIAPHSCHESIPACSAHWEEGQAYRVSNRANRQPLNRCSGEASQEQSSAGNRNILHFPWSMVWAFRECA